MSVRMCKNLLQLRGLASSTRRWFTAGKIIFNKPSSANTSGVTGGTNLSKVSGLSDNVIAPTKTPVGPGAAKDSNYKNPEYFLYNRMSFFEAEKEMANYRCPQPSNKS